MNISKSLQWAAILVLVISVLACGVFSAPPTTSSTSVPPTATMIVPVAVSPITVEGVQLQITLVERQDTFEGYMPNNTNLDTLLVVHAKMLGDTSIDNLHSVDWRQVVSVIDENQRESELGQLNYNSLDGIQVTEFAWVFVVTKTSRSFTLKLPEGQTVNLTLNK